MKELIDALGVLANPNASEEERAAALEKLSAYFNSQLDAEEAKASEAAEKPEPEKKSEAGDGEKDKDDDKQEMSSALASALEQLGELKARLGKFEKASAIASAPRAQKPTVLERNADDASAPKDHVVQMIETAGRNTTRNLSKQSR